MTGQTKRIGLLAAALALIACAGPAQAGEPMGLMIPGVTGPNFTLTAKGGYIQTPEPGALYMWGYANGAGDMQYPGPTLIVNQGDAVSVTLNNALTVNVSIVFPGHKVTAAGGAAGLITQEATPGGTVTYTFTAGEPGTYLYHSGTRPELQIEMGLFGALIVRPAMMHHAYNHIDSHYDHEVLFLESEADPVIHELVETGKMDQVDNTRWWPTYWFLNGRCAPDTMLPAGTPILPNQPYDCMPMIQPGQRLLMRVLNAGRDFHPFHTHGNNFTTIARDGRLLSSAPGAGADLAESDFTITVTPGGTADCIFEWTGAKMGWDIYGHKPGDALEPNEDPDDHGKPFPVILPDNRDLTFGVHYSGSPFLGAAGALPPGEGGFNPVAGFFFMWHSHKEKEMCTNNVFPGGMMTMFLIVPPGMPIMPMP